MERLEAPWDNFSLESSLTDLILNPKSEKIRRPPNAFMLFARDHRRLISKQHPDVSNKVVSSMLGKLWKNTVRDVKEKYYNKAKILGDLHKRRYPDYVYSPREARIQKMNKKKKKDAANSTETASQREDLAAAVELTKLEDNSKEEEWITDANNEPKSSPGYVPNNPEYFAQRSPEILPEEDEALDFRPRSDYSVESQYHQGSGDLPLQMDQGWTEKNCRRPTPVERCGCCNQSRLGPGMRCVPPYERRENEVAPRFQDHIPCSYATASPFCNPPPLFTGPMSSYCCGPRPCTSPIPRTYGPPLHPYWNSPIMNSPCYPGREYFYDELKPYPFSTPYHAPDFYGPFGYFDRPLTQPKRNFDSTFYPHFREGLSKQTNEFSRRGQNGLEADSSVPYSCHNSSDEKEDSARRSFDGGLTAEDEMMLRNRRILRSDIKNKEQMVHQNQINRTEIRPQDASSFRMRMPANEEGSLLAERRHLNNHQYPDVWDSHSTRDKSPGMTSTDPVPTEQYECNSGRRKENENSTELTNHCQTQSQDVLSPILSTETQKRKLDSLYSESNDSVTSTHPKHYRLSIVPTSDATGPHLWSSTVAKSPLPKSKIQELCNKPATIQEQLIYSNSENNTSVTSSNQHLANTNKISTDFLIANQDKIRPGNIIVDQQGVPLNLGFSQVPIQMTEECPNIFDSSDLQNSQIQRKNHISVNVQQPLVCKPFVKTESSGQNIYSISEINEKSLKTSDDKNNQQSTTFRVARNIEHENFLSTTAKQNINSIKDQTNIENNSFVSSNNVVENTKVRPHILANVIPHANQTNVTDNSKYDLSKAYYETLSRPQENFPGFSPLTSQSSVGSCGAADHGSVNSNLPVFIKMEHNENDRF